MSLLPTKENKYVEARGSYKDFLIVAYAAKNDYVVWDIIRVNDKENRIPQSRFYVRFGQELRYESMIVKQQAGLWRSFGYELDDLQGLTNAANKILKELRLNKNYPKRTLIF